MFKDYSNTKDWFPVYEGIFEDRHVTGIGPAMWLFLWFVARETGSGKVLNGRPVKVKDIDLPFSTRIKRDWIERLRDRGYIRTKRAPQGLIFTVNRSKRHLHKTVNHKGELQKSVEQNGDLQNSVNQESERVTEDCQSELQKSVNLNNNRNNIHSNKQKECASPKTGDPRIKKFLNKFEILWNDQIGHGKEYIPSHGKMKSSLKIY